MKPVDKGQSLGRLQNYTDAKPHLIFRLGSQCSYCEQFGYPQALHVEHIYPQDPHSELENEWDNLLLACSTCNSYKNKHLGSKRQVNLESRYLWPHLDNTANAFKYFDDGRIELSDNLPQDVKQAAENTIDMVGALKSPTKAATFQDIGIAYDGMRKRKDMWEIASESRAEYLHANGGQSAASLARRAAKMGFFSIWMTVFHDCREVRSELIESFKADKTCFGPSTQPRPKGRI